MTCKELAAILTQYPDDMPVTIKDLDENWRIVTIHHQITLGTLELFGKNAELDWGQ